MKERIIELNYHNYINNDDKFIIDFMMAINELFKNTDNFNVKEKVKIKVINITSDKFTSLIPLENDKEFNGWQNDWRDTMVYNNYAFKVIGEPWYGNIEVYYAEE